MRIGQLTMSLAELQVQGRSVLAPRAANRLARARASAAGEPVLGARLGGDGGLGGALG